MSSADYARVESAIDFLERNFRQQPSLAEVAASVGLSEYHFQRLFTRWVGISPKRFLQYQTVEYAKQLLRESRALLDVTYDAGLSSAGRLHDLFVTLEAVTPGEYKRGGDGLVISYGVHPSPFGDCLLGLTERGICALTFVDAAGPERAVDELGRAWPGASLREAPRATGPVLEQVFEWSPATAAPLRVVVRGTNFQVKVWKALLRIPAGMAVSYEDVAAMAGRPEAVRAAGSAIGRNPICYLIPCHRVIRKSGDFGNYGGGPARKRAMLAWEAAHVRPGADEDAADADVTPAAIAS